MKKYEQYYQKILEIEKQIITDEAEKIERVSRELALTLKRENCVYLFGCGHSHILEEEAFYRAGGLVPVYPVFDSALMLHEGACKSSALEKQEAYGGYVFDRLSVQPGDMMFVFSTSGRNGCPIEMAMRAGQAGATVVVVTSLVYREKEESRHSSGKHLCEVGDIIIDNHVPYGDALIDTGRQMIAPCSTVVTAMIWNMIIAQTYDAAAEIGYVPEYFMSGNISGGAQANAKYIEKYKAEIHYL